MIDIVKSKLIIFSVPNIFSSIDFNLNGSVLPDGVIRHQVLEIWCNFKGLGVTIFKLGTRHISGVIW